MWRKSSYSNSQGACIEVSTWRTSYRSWNSGACVQAGTGPGVVGVRDTTQAGSPSRTVIEFSARAWREFIGGLK